MQTRRYTVTVQGRLGTRFARTFPGAMIKSGSGDTRLLTEPFDQAQLHGLLNRIRDFGIDILAVEATSPQPSHDRGSPRPPFSAVAPASPHQGRGND